MGGWVSGWWVRMRRSRSRRKRWRRRRRKIDRHIDGWVGGWVGRWESIGTWEAGRADAVEEEEASVG